MSVDPNWDDLVERGRAALALPPLSRDKKSGSGTTDPKWILGDVLLHVPEHLLGKMATALGRPESELRRAREVASRWPTDKRVNASWSAHRDLKDRPDRFERIVPGMTVRQAAEAAGKRPIDAKPIGRMSLAEKSSYAVSLLLDKKVNEAVVAEMEARALARKVRRAAKLASDDRSAEYKEATRLLREAQQAKSPDVAFVEVVFNIQKLTEYLRAVIAGATVAADGSEPLIPPYRRPDLMYAIESLSDVVQEALSALDGKAERATARNYIDVDLAQDRRELLETPHQV